VIETRRTIFGSVLRMAARFRSVALPAVAVLIVGTLAVATMTHRWHGSADPGPRAGRATAAGTGGRAAGAGPSGRPIGRPIGVADPDLIGAPASTQTSTIQAMKAIGITAVRLDARWDWVQYGGPTSYDWKDLDQAVGHLRAAGMTVDLLVAGCPDWAASGDRGRSGARHPASAAQFGQWAAAGSAADPAGYAAILAAAYRAIKTVSVDTVVLSGGLAPVATANGDLNGTAFLASVYAHGGRGTFDAVGYHAFCYPTLPDVYQPWSGWSQMAGTSPSLRSVMSANGDSGKQIWITEVGAPSAGPGGVGEQVQARTVTQAVTDASAAPWVGGLFVYSWRDAGTDPSDPEDWFGLITKDGAAKPAMAALQRSIAASWQA
jgi:hypothetical protein